MANDRSADGRAFALAAGDLRAVLLPAQGMLVASLCHRGAELLRRVEDLDVAAAKGKTAGIPLLHPWANRLSGMRYVAAGGPEVVLDAASSLLHFDDRGLPMHGVPWSRLCWQVVDSSRVHVVARLDWRRPELLAVFPFPHSLELAITLHPGGLTFDTTLEAGAEGRVPVSFGFHPFFGLPGLERDRWHLTLPAMQRLTLDDRGIPTGVEEPFAGLDRLLGGLDLDDGFAVAGEPALSVAGAGRRIAVELVEGFGHAQVFAPKGKDFVALEPMTAPTNALTSGRGLRLVEPGRSFRAVFRVRIDDAR